MPSTHLELDGSITTSAFVAFLLAESAASRARLARLEGASVDDARLEATRFFDNGAALLRAAGVDAAALAFGRAEVLAATNARHDAAVQLAALRDELRRLRTAYELVIDKLVPTAFSMLNAEQVALREELARLAPGPAAATAVGAARAAAPTVELPPYAVPAAPSGAGTPPVDERDAVVLDARSRVFEERLNALLEAKRVEHDRAELEERARERRAPRAPWFARLFGLA